MSESDCEKQRFNLSHAPTLGFARSDFVFMDGMHSGWPERIGL
jgi:hypothetical protein